MRSGIDNRKPSYRSLKTDLVCLNPDDPGTADHVIVLIMSGGVGIAEGTSWSGEVSSTHWEGDHEMQSKLNLHTYAKMLSRHGYTGTDTKKDTNMPTNPQTK